MSPRSAGRIWRRDLQGHTGNYTHLWAPGLQSKSECRPALLLGMGSYRGGWGYPPVRIRQSTKAWGFHPCSLPQLSPFPRKSCIRDFKAFPRELSSSSYQMALSHCQHPISKHASIPAVRPQAGQATTLHSFQLASRLTAEPQTSRQTLSH